VSGNTADIEVSLNGPAVGTPGTPFTYTATIRNNGPAPASGIMVKQGLPPGLQIGTITSTHGSPTLQDNVLRTSIPALAPNESAEIKTVVTPNYDFVTVLVSSLHEDLGEPFDPKVGNNSIDIATVIGDANGEADISVENGSLDANPDNFTFTITVHNRGPSAAAGVVVYTRYQDSPEGLRTTSITSTKGVCSPPDIKTPECHVALMGKDESFTITVKGVYPGGYASRAFSILASVFSKNVDPNFNNNRAGAFDSVDSLPPPLGAEISRSQGNVRVQFPDPSKQLELQSTDKLSSSSTWQPVPPASITSDGNGVQTFETTPGNSSMFFRLMVKPPPPPVLPVLHMFQENLFLDRNFIPYSDWGRVDMTLPSRPGAVQYANLAIEATTRQSATLSASDWVIVNLPVLTTEAEGSTELVSVNFPWNVYGNPIPSAKYGFSLTPQPRDSAPPTTNEIAVFPFDKIERPGTTNTVLSYFPAPRLTGSTVRSNSVTNPGFPNVEQGWNECAPAAILNSVTYLNRQFNLGIAAAELTMDKMKTATGWTIEGSPGGDFGEPAGWPDLKADYMRTHNLPIQTLETDDPKLAMEALSQGWDVEIRMRGHAAAVVAISDLLSGSFAITISHDIAQAKAGGTVRQVTTLNTASGELSGSSWSSEFIEFVIEKPSAP
jgi:uncharacterized repeat protein (TIGR01451 family)